MGPRNIYTCCMRMHKIISYMYTLCHRWKSEADKAVKSLSLKGASVIRYIVR